MDPNSTYILIIKTTAKDENQLSVIFLSHNLANVYKLQVYHGDNL